MPKVGFTKLGLKVNTEVNTSQFNDQLIEVKQYLPVEKKLQLITEVLELSHDQNNFANPIKIQVFTLLKIVEYYTNINFTDKQKEDPVKLYDSMFSSGFFPFITELIPEDEYNEIIDGIKQTVEAVYKYQNSVLGILETISQDYSNLDFDATSIQQKLADPDNMALLKDVLSKLG